MLVLLTKRAHRQPAARPAGGSQPHTDQAPASAVTIRSPKSGSTESDDDESVGQPEKLELPIEEMLSMAVVARSERSTPTPRRMSESRPRRRSFTAVASHTVVRLRVLLRLARVLAAGPGLLARRLLENGIQLDSPWPPTRRELPGRALPGQARRANVVSRPARARASAQALPLGGDSGRRDLGVRPTKASRSCCRRSATRFVPTRPTSPSPGAAARSAPCCRCKELPRRSASSLSPAGAWRSTRFG